MHPEPLFKIFGNGVYAYGLCMAIGIILCFAFLMFTMWKQNFNDEASDKILLIGVFGTGFGIFSAMLVQSLYNCIADPEHKYTLDGSMTFLGGLIGGVVGFLGVWWLYVYVIAPRTKIKILQNNMNAGLTDAIPFIPIAICIAHAFGRFGCFFGGCCYGKKTDAWFGIACASGWSDYYGMNMDGVKVVPTQLFEMIFLLVLAGVMAVLYFKFKFKPNFAVYMIAYGIWRFIIEYVRADERGTLFPGVALYPSQILSVLMVAFGIGYIFLYKYVFAKQMKHPELQPSVRPPKRKKDEKTV